MADYGSKTSVVNAQAMYWNFAGGKYLLLTNKRFSYRRPQKRIATGIGPIYFSMLSDNRFTVQVAYTTGEVGVGVPQAFDQMILANATTHEVPENTFTFTLTDRAGTPKTNTWTLKAKMTSLDVSGLGEGETLVDMEFQITDDVPAVT